ncbi:MAG: 4-hydroxy-tetrahydrodipicolinate reductase [Pseudomonadota bacterium]
MTSPLNICVIGAAGRMGRLILREAIIRSDLNLVGGVVSHDSVHLNEDLGDLAELRPAGVEAMVSIEQAAASADVMIDVSAAHVTPAIAERLLEAKGGPALVCGVTGLDEAAMEALKAASVHTPVFYARNFSPGAALMERLVALAAGVLTPESWDIEIVEAHHRRKTDAPSGTALMIGEAAADARGQSLDDEAIYARPRSGASRPVGAIGFSAIRGGAVIGEHSARFLSAFEELEVRHKAHDRFVFVRGAIDAALWMAGREPGFYSMQDMIA